MQFNQLALDAKMKHLDEIKNHPDIVSRVLERNIIGSYLITEQTRVWTGGVLPFT